MRTRRRIGIIMMMLALLMGATSDVWGQDIVGTNIHIRVLPELEDDAVPGTVTVTSIGKETEEETYKRKVTITVTPSSGYIIRKEMIQVERMKKVPEVESHVSRRAPDLADLITLSGTDPTDLESERTYTFVVPDDYDGAYITATFVKKPADTNVKVITSLDEITNMNGIYQLGADIDVPSTFAGIEGPFTGTLDGNFHTIRGLEKPIFTTATGATIKNVMFQQVGISQAGRVGAICCTADGTTRIYNCGILPTDIDNTDALRSTVVSTDNHCGSLVGYLDGYARVINCFSYANVSAGEGSDEDENDICAGGLVGYNTTATMQGNNQTNFNNNVKTMVVNCMFYGDIKKGTKKYPVYGGTAIVNNAEHKVNNYNYFCEEEASFDKKYSAITDYNYSWPVAKKYLVRFEVYRNILNSNRRLCTWWVNGTYRKDTDTDATDSNVESVGIAKWVLDKSIAPYPILKKWGKYFSTFDIDPAYVWNPKMKRYVSRSSANAWEGKSYGTIEVTINGGSNNSSASDTKYITITDMDTLGYDYCAKKIQLPYYNEIFGNPNGADWTAKYGNNYHNNKVVTGWKITAVNDNDTGSSYTFNDDWESGNNFADRSDKYKDLYAKSGRVFAQGGYYYVPEGVTSITIEAYWGNAVYICNSNRSLDKVANGEKEFYVAGKLPQYVGGENGQNGTPKQEVQTSWDSALGALKKISAEDSPGSTVYDQAIVLVGNYQKYSFAYGEMLLNGSQYETNAKPFTIMSADFDLDNEPDFCFQAGMNNTTRPNLQPVRFDFLMVPDITMAIRTSEAYWGIRNICPQGHYEVTETSYMYVTQFEYEIRTGDNKYTKHEAPMILNGGEFTQIVSTHTFTQASQDATATARADRTSYFLIGGKLYMKAFTPGTHVNTRSATRHCAVNAIGGEFPEFYLSGMFRSDFFNMTDNPHAYLDGGWFGMVAGAGMESVGAKDETNGGDVTFKIYHSRIHEFYGGGINATRPVTGNIDVTIDNSIVHKYCGGPKLGNMNSDKTITTSATNTTFDLFFGGGNGGTNMLRENKYDGYQIVAPTPGTENPGVWNNNNQGKFNNFTPFNYEANKGYQAEFEFELLPIPNGVTTTVPRTYYHYASFSKTMVAPITTTITDCTFNGNLYGGGNLGAVGGNVATTLQGHTVVHGSVFGAGFSASIPSFPVHDKSSVNYAYRDFAGFIHDGSLDYKKYETEAGGHHVGDTIYYTWIHDVPSEWNISPAPTTSNKNRYFEYPTGSGNWYVYTPESLTGLGTVEGNVFLTIKDDTEIAGNVYGGGDESAVAGSTSMDIQGNVSVSGNVYGGGNIGSIGTIDSHTPHTTLLDNTNTITNDASKEAKVSEFGLSWPEEFIYKSANYKNKNNEEETAVTGQTIVNIESGSVGGSVFGGGRGKAGNRYEMADTANVRTTEVNIGKEDEAASGPTIGGSVYGGGENGHVNEDAIVHMYGGAIGESLYGGGKGRDKYNTTLWNVGSTTESHAATIYSLSAGKVYGNTTVLMSAGTVAYNVYGGGDLGSVGKGNYAGGPDDYTVAGYGETIPESSGLLWTTSWTEDNQVKDLAWHFKHSGKTRVEITGGTIGSATGKVDEDDMPTGNVFGGCKGLAAPNVDMSISPRYRYYPEFYLGYINESEVIIGTEDQSNEGAGGEGKAPRIYGSVYGGGQDGHVRRDTYVTIYSGEIGNTFDGDFADTSDAEWKLQNRRRGNVYGAGSGLGKAENPVTHEIEHSNSSGSVTHNTTVNINGGIIHQNVYGGGALASVGPPAMGQQNTLDRSVTLCQVNINSTVGVEDNYTHTNVGKTFYYGGNVYGGTRGDASLGLNESRFSTTTFTEVNIHTNGTVVGSVYAGGESGLTKQSTELNMLGGTVNHDVYGGGELAGTGNTLVNLLSGRVEGDAFGGGLGRRAVNNVPAVNAYVGDTKVNLNGMDIADYVSTGSYKDFVVDATEVYKSHTDGDEDIVDNKLEYFTIKNDKGCIIGGRIFGCNNIYGSPKGTANVHVFATQNAYTKTISNKFIKDDGDITTLNDKDELKEILADKITLASALSVSTTTAQEAYDGDYGDDDEAITAYRTAIANLNTAIKAKDESDINDIRYDVKAVYGGGNLAAYQPSITPTPSAHVVINGCDYTSIETVYGGGNAAPVSGTDVTINSDYEINYLFGGGNGRESVRIFEDMRYLDIENNGADVGILREEGNEISYGTGIASSKLNGGTVNHVFAGSDFKGNVRGGTDLQIADNNTKNNNCQLAIKELYGAGREAEQDGGVMLVLGCVDNLGIVYGGAKDANIKGGVNLVITSGTFDKVFGGNDHSGTIQGPITLSIEETACDPIEIGELYLGGNEAGYSIYGYKEVSGNLEPRESADDGDVATGTTAPPSGGWRDPILNIVSCTSIGKVFGGGYKALMVGSPTININMIPGEHADLIDRDNDGESDDEDGTLLGEIGDVFGGGNEADIYGNTTINICTETTVTLKSTRETKQVTGAYITGNVFGGGNLGNVGRFRVATTTDIENDKNRAGINRYGAFEEEYEFKEDEPYERLAGGKCTVNIGGNAEIGPNDMMMKKVDGEGNPIHPDDKGHVFGAGRGFYHLNLDPSERYDEKYDLMAYVNETEVNISGNAFIKGSVYGGSENGHVLNDTYVNISGNCQIGNGWNTNPERFDSKVGGVNRRYTDAEWIDPKTTTVTNENSLPECAQWDFGKPLFDDENQPIYIQQTNESGEPLYLDGDGNTTTEATDNPIWVQKINEDGRLLYLDGEGNLTTEASGNLPAYMQLEEHLPYNPFATNSTTDARTVGSDGHTFYGNVFGGGSGYYPYYDGEKSQWVRRAGRVRGNTHVKITGGHILTSVYGGCELTDVLGDCEVEMTGGTLGVPRTIEQINAHPVTCYLFGAGKGDQRTYFNKWTNVRHVTIKIAGTALIYGSVFGGGEDGHVLGNVTMTIGETGTPWIGTWGTSYVEGNVFGGGRGFGGDALTAGNVGGSVEVNIKGGTMLGSIYGGGRLGSVGYGLFDVDVDEDGNDEEGYGEMQDDGIDDAGNSFDNFNRGWITVNISGGTIGNDRENLFIDPEIKDNYKENAPDLRALKTAYHIPYTTFNADNQLDHSKGGNVFGGCMGRLTKINGVEYLNQWDKLGAAKKSFVNVSGGTIKGSVYGGSEFGTLTENATVEVTGGTIMRDVFGGGYGSAVITTNIGGHTPMEIAGRVSGNTSVTISGGHVHKGVYGGGELASVGVIKDNPIMHNDPANGFALSWPYEFKVKDIDNDSNDEADADGNTAVTITGGRVGLTGKDYMGPTDPMTGDIVMIKKKDGGGFETINYLDLDALKTAYKDAYETARQDNGDVFGGGKGLAGDRYEMAYCNNVNNTEVIINISSSEATPENYKNRLDYPCLPGSVYGGAENGHVIGNTSVTLENGLIGHCIYGGGKGKGKHTMTLLKWKDDNGVKLNDDEIKSRYYHQDGSGNYTTIKNIDDITNEDYKHDVDIYSITAGKVYGNTVVTMKGGYVIRNIFGGGNMGSVGKGNYTGGANDYSSGGYGELPPKVGNQPGLLWPENSDPGNTDFLNSGKCTVNIKGGNVGYLYSEKDDNKKDDLPLGNVFGGCRGQAAPQVSTLLSPRINYCPEFYSGYVNETEVNIGDVSGDGPTILGSVYGGGQDGHVRRDTKVTVNKGVIGLQITPELRTVFGENFSTDLQWLHRGNVYGSGSGIGKDSDDLQSTSSGSVTGHTEVNILGGTIYRSVYGGGSLSSIGPPPVGRNSNPLYNDETKFTSCVVNIDGANVKVGNETNVAAGYGGNVFGASRGETSLGESYGAVVQTEVNVKRGHVYGNVFGGGDAGIVKKNPKVTIGEMRVTP